MKVRIKGYQDGLVHNLFEKHMIAVPTLICDYILKRLEMDMPLETEKVEITLSYHEEE